MLAPIVDISGDMAGRMVHGAIVQRILGKPHSRVNNGQILVNIR